MSYLPAGLPAPMVENDGLDAPYWQGTRDGVLRVQHCATCGTWQWGAEWICHGCRKLNPEWAEVAPHGVIYTWSRLWHPVHPSLKGHGPYLAVLVELPHAGGIRMLGNLLGDPMQEVRIGDAVEAVFEPHDGYTLVQWRTRG